MKDKIFFSIVFGFIFGVLLNSLFMINIYVGILLSVISLGIIVFHKIISRNNWGVLAGIFVMAFSFGIFRFNFAENNIATVLDSWSGKQIEAGQSVSLSGMISDEPEIKENNQKLIVEVGDKNKLKIRGYNQSEELAKELSKVLQVPVISDFLTKTKPL